MCLPGSMAIAVKVWCLGFSVKKFMTFARWCMSLLCLSSPDYSVESWHVGVCIIVLKVNSLSRLAQGTQFVDPNSTTFLQNTTLNASSLQVRQHRFLWWWYVRRRKKRKKKMMMNYQGLGFRDTGWLWDSLMKIADIVCLWVSSVLQAFWSQLEYGYRSTEKMGPLFSMHPLTRPLFWVLMLMLMSLSRMMMTRQCYKLTSLG